MSNLSTLTENKQKSLAYEKEIAEFLANKENKITVLKIGESGLDSLKNMTPEERKERQHLISQDIQDRKKESEKKQAATAKARADAKAKEEAQAKKLAEKLAKQEKEKALRLEKKAQRVAAAKQRDMERLLNKEKLKAERKAESKKLKLVTFPEYSESHWIKMLNGILKRSAIEKNQVSYEANCLKHGVGIFKIYEGKGYCSTCFDQRNQLPEEKATAIRIEKERRLFNKDQMQLSVDNKTYKFLGHCKRHGENVEYVAVFTKSYGYRPQCVPCTKEKGTTESRKTSKQKSEQTIYRVAYKQTFLDAKKKGLKQVEFNCPNHGKSIYNVYDSRMICSLCSEDYKEREKNKKKAEKLLNPKDSKEKSPKQINIDKAKDAIARGDSLYNGTCDIHGNVVRRVIVRKSGHLNTRCLECEQLSNEKYQGAIYKANQSSPRRLWLQDKIESNPIEFREQLSEFLGIGMESLRHMKTGRTNINDNTWLKMQTFVFKGKW